MQAYSFNFFIILGNAFKTGKLINMIDHVRHLHKIYFIFSSNGDNGKKPPTDKLCFCTEKAQVLNHIDIMKKLDNVFLDISGTGIIRYGVIKKLVSEVGAQRILFGTDYPIGNLQVYINGVFGEKISDYEKELIFRGNAKNLLKI